MKIFIFDSIHYVLKAEALLNNNEIKNELIPVPKEIHSNCGMAIKIDDNNINIAKRLFSEHNINCKIFSYAPEINFYFEEEK